MSHQDLSQLNIVDSLVQKQVNLNNKLDTISKIIQWNNFDEILQTIYSNKRGRPSFPPVYMFRILILQQWYNLSDYEMEASLDDRLSFRRFSGFGLGDKIPDHSTISRFREQLIKYKLQDKLFEELNRQIDAFGLILKKGTLVDATLVEANVSKPDKQLNGQAGISETDPEAEWTRRGKKSYFGYKAHLAVDQTTDIIRKAKLTSANVNEGLMLAMMICDDEEMVYADKQYDSRRNREILNSKCIKDGLMKKGCMNRKVTQDEKDRNKLLAPIRAGIEKVFGTFKRSYKYTRARYIGLTKNTLQFILICMSFNLRKMERLIIF